MIEKNIRLQPHHSRDLLVGRRSDGKRPGYQPPGRGGSGGGPPSQGGGGGGGRDAPSRSAPSRPTPSPPRDPAPAPAPAPSPHRDDSAERAAQAVADRLNAQRAEAERASNLAEARKLMTQLTPVDVPIKGPELIPGTTGPFVADPYQQNYISPGEVYFKDRYQTGDYAGLVKAPVDVGFQEALRKQQIATDLREKQQDPDYGQFFRPQPVVEKPKFFDTGAGKFVKGVGKVALQPFIPEPVQRALTGIGAARTGAKFAKAITGKNIPQIPSNEDLIRSAFTKGNLRSTIDKRRPSDMPEHLGERGFTTRAKHEPVERDGIQEAITGGDVITETAKKYASLNDDQINYIRTQLKGKDPEELRSILTQAKSRIESGEASDIEKDVFALVQEYLVDPTQYTAHGGRIDSPLMGRNRYI